MQGFFILRLPQSIELRYTFLDLSHRKSLQSYSLIDIFFQFMLAVTFSLQSHLVLE